MSIERAQAEYDAQTPYDSEDNELADAQFAIESLVEDVDALIAAAWPKNPICESFRITLENGEVLVDVENFGGLIADAYARRDDEGNLDVEEPSRLDLLNKAEEMFATAVNAIRKAKSTLEIEEFAESHGMPSRPLEHLIGKLGWRSDAELIARGWAARSSGAI